ncbi:hypothetical protein ACHAWO_003045 [Cyclotella atomus]|uniref:peptidylprolyl isomerase n=1 Tax=Cyclotella atomus TaxID=382360 RepID=A0ABD3NDR7_9STRA
MKQPFLLPLLAASSTGAFTSPSTNSQRPIGVKLDAVYRDEARETSRRDVLQIIGGSFAMAMGANVMSAQALVEGNPVPTKVKKSLPEEYRQGTAALADSEEAEVLPREAYNKLSSGVIYADISQGNGETVKEGSRVNLQWVLRRSNGYFVDSSAVSDSVPFIFTVGDPNGAIAGLDEGIRGMKAGGTRRILIPPRLAYVNGVDDGLPGPIPAGFGPRQQMRRVMQVRKDVPGEYIFLEVKLTKVR